MAFPTDIDPVPVFQASDTLIVAQHHALHTSILDRVYQIQNFLGGSPGTETGGSMRTRLKTAEATIATHTGQITNSQVPVGTIIAYGGAAAPAGGWALCNGTAHGSSALKTVLATVVGSGAASDITPDLRDRFILGKGSLPSPGGAQQVTLTAAQSGLPAHNHAVTVDSANTDHLHTFTTGYMSANVTHGHTGSIGGGGAHIHQLHMLDGTAEAGKDGSGFDSSPNQGWNNYPPNGETVAGGGTHSHSVGIGDANTNHTHSGTTNGADRVAGQNHVHTASSTNNAAVGATAAVNIMNPYYALVYIIKT